MHVGKIIPRTIVNAVIFPNFVGNYNTNPRRIRLVFDTSTTPGTVGTRWNGGTWVSDVADYWSTDKTWVFYRIENTSYADNYAEVRWRWVAGDTISLSDQMYADVSLEIYDTVGLVARQSAYTSWNPFLANTTVYNPIFGPTWAYRRSVPEWNVMRCGTKMAKWEDSPEWEPYNPRP